MPESACQTCLGVGTYLKTEEFLLIINPEKSIRKGALDLRWGMPVMVESLAQHYKFSLEVPFKELPENVKKIIFYGTKGEKIEVIPSVHTNPEDSRIGKRIPFEGIVNYIDRAYRHYRKRGAAAANSYNYWKHFMVEYPCPDCCGMKLRKQKLLVTVGRQSIHNIGELSLIEMNNYLKNFVPPKEKKETAVPIINEITKRLDLLIDIGLGYINLNRRAYSLSGGETQRIRLSTQIGAELMGMLYVLDEPSIGLHQKDSHKVIKTLKKLRDIGNTVIVIEHDLETILQADYILEMGPGPGLHGGQVYAQGRLDTILEDPNFLTGKFLKGEKRINVPKIRRRPNGHSVKIIGAQENNLKNIDIEIPLGVFMCITGVSGSGKSSLISEILYKKLYATLKDPRILPGKHKAIQGLEHIIDIRNIDQTAIGSSTRSNPATYIGVYDKIRQLFAALPEAKERGYNIGYFSFNSVDGRCYECKGEGEKKTQLQFMPDVKITCPVCKGTRYIKEVLEIKYQGKNIAEILDMSVEEALTFFKNVRLIHHKLTVMNDLGLGYLKLGQPALTLSGGEAQRIKLTKELGKLKKIQGNLYILDEPTTGLHMEDIQRLLDCLNRLVDAGNTVLVIEHNLEVIKTADYIIDLGPEGGEEGGFIVAKGTPEEICKVQKSYTGQFLKKMIETSVKME
ncbi:MAG: excinuclease ABC subunit UvrA [Candidatus Hodarchaeota archaeon]